MTTSPSLGVGPGSNGRPIGTIVGATSRVDRWLLAAAPAQRLAALRILVGGFVAVYMTVMVNEFGRVSRLPTGDFKPVGIATLLSGPLSPGQVWACFVLTLVSGVAFTAGIGFPLSGPAFALAALGWASYHSSWGQMLHFEHLFTLHVLILGFSPAADVWSLRFQRGTDRPFRLSFTRSAKAPPAHVRYGWPIKLLAIVTAVTYVVSALTKLRMSGFAWVDASNLGNHIAYSATRLDLLGAWQPPLAGFVLSNRWLLGPMAWAALLIELFAPVALLGRRWRRWWVVVALLMHTGTAATMLVWFPFHGLGFGLLPLFRCERLISEVFSRSCRVASRLRG